MLCGLRLVLRYSPHQRPLPHAKASFHSVSFHLATENEPQFAARIKRIIFRGGHHQINLRPHHQPDVSLALTLRDTALLSVDGHRWRCRR